MIMYTEKNIEWLTWYLYYYHIIRTSFLLLCSLHDKYQNKYWFDLKCISIFLLHKLFVITYISELIYQRLSAFSLNYTLTNDVTKKNSLLLVLMNICLLDIKIHLWKSFSLEKWFILYLNSQSVVHEVNNPILRFWSKISFTLGNINQYCIQIEKRKWKRWYKRKSAMLILCETSQNFDFLLMTQKNQIYGKT